MADVGDIEAYLEAQVEQQVSVSLLLLLSWGKGKRGEG